MQTHPPRALVVDDSAAVRRILARMLAELGWSVREAGHGREALSVLAGDGPFDLALIDSIMPDMGGLELLCAVRARAEWAATRVMVVTTDTEAASIRAALQAGADEYMMKPFTRDMLTDKLAMLGLCTASQ